MGWIRKRPDRPSPWRAGYRGPDGREHSRSFERKVDAERWLRSELQKMDRGIWVDPEAGNITVDEWSVIWMSGRVGLTEKTRAGYQRILNSRILPTFGAVPVKNSVYVLPRSDEAVEDLRWVQREIEEGGGEASLCEAEFLDGLSDEEVTAAFRAARDADYRTVQEEAERIAAEARRDRAGVTAGALPRLRRRLEQIAAIDFFAAGGRAEAEAALDALERLGRADREPASPSAPKNFSNSSCNPGLT